VERRIVEFIPKTADGSKLRVNVDLQDDFSMDQTLSLYLLETIPLLDPQSPEYALDLLTLVESILENPEVILRRQLDKVKDRAMAEMKAEGLEYEQRMEELEKLEYPKPLVTSFTEPSTPSPTGIHGSARRASGRSRSRGRCSRTSARLPSMCSSTSCSVPRDFCCDI
jgi:hypothetical protein